MALEFHKIIKFLINFIDEGFDNSKIIQNVSKIVFDEYMKIINKKLIQHKELEKISPGIAKLLIDQASSVIIMQNIDENIYNQRIEHLKNYEENLKKKHKIKSLIYDWCKKS